jgi:hypothetical protein
MGTLFTGTAALFELVITLLVLPLLICLSFLLPYGMGKGLNSVLLAGKSFNISYLLCAFIGGMGFFSLTVMVLGASFLQIFSISAAEWWYQHLFPLGATGNIIGIICSFSSGFFRGKIDQ